MDIGRTQIWIHIQHQRGDAGGVGGGDGGAGVTGVYVVDGDSVEAKASGSADGGRPAGTVVGDGERKTVVVGGADRDHVVEAACRGVCRGGAKDGIGGNVAD